MLDNLQLCECMFHLKCIQDAPDRRVGAGDDTLEAVEPPFRKVGGLQMVASQARCTQCIQRMPTDEIPIFKKLIRVGIQSAVGI